jgi:protein TonB
LHEYTVEQEGESTLNRALNRTTAIAVLLLGAWMSTGGSPAWGQVEIGRAVKTKVTPVYPELAKRMNIVGVVKVQITVAPNGSVKNAKVLGGHPVLANAALEAVKQWRFETASGETTGIVQFRFDPSQ